MKLLIIGTVALDSVQTPSGKNSEAIGGSAVYASLSASYFTSTKIISIAGTDFPKKNINALKKKNIDVSGIEIRKGKTFRWEGRYGKDLNSAQTLATHLNLLTKFNPELTNPDKKCTFILLANNDPDLQLRIISQAQKTKIIAADTIDFWIRTKRAQLQKVLKKVDIFVINEDEARLLTGEQNLIKAARRMISIGTTRVIIKKGEDGLIYATKKDIFAIPAFPLEMVIDPTGAGDSFAGGFLGYLAEQKSLNEAKFRKALVYGTIMASYNVQGFDIKVLANLNKKLIEKRYKAFKELTRF